MTKQYHLYHMVEKSPWPLFMGMTVLSMTSSVVLWFKYSFIYGVLFSLLVVSFISYKWWKDVTREASFMGFHSLEVKKGLKEGMILFIFSEVMFFSSFFWTFIHASLAPCSELGLIWPPISVEAMNPFQIPLLNTAILLSSGFTVTYAHHNLMSNKKITSMLLVTIMLGVYFTSLQVFEYMNSFFSVSDSVYGSIFFVGTGFHGFHVIIGTLFLLACYFRLSLNHFNLMNMLGLEMAIWYWHFVDVVWLFLFSLIYWWGF